MRCAAVIAAAGLSSRMHEFKPLMYLQELPLIDHVVQTLRKTGVEQIMVVTGYRSEQLAPHLLQLHAVVCYNAQYAQTGMFESLCLGIRNLREPYDGVFLMPGDVPLVQVETLLRMQEISGDIIRPVCGGKPGHPILVRHQALSHLLAYQGSEGLRGAIRSFTGILGELAVEDPGIHMDADTPEDFKNLRKQAHINRSQGRLWADITITLMGVESVLSQESAQLLEMIGHTHSIANACACVHISYSKGWKLLNQMEKEIGFSLVERNAGGEGGGSSSLTPRGRRLLEAYQAYCAEVRRYAQNLFEQKFSMVQEDENP